MHGLAQALHDANLASVNFLNVEVDTGQMFADIAKQTDNTEKRAHNRINARTAYDTILRFIGRVTMTEAESETLGGKLAKLKSDLQGLGELF